MLPGEARHEYWQGIHPRPLYIKSLHTEKLAMTGRCILPSGSSAYFSAQEVLQSPVSSLPGKTGQRVLCPVPIAGLDS
jgi:hypothetical protein